MAIGSQRANMATATESNLRPRKTMPLRRLVQLMLEDLAIYNDTIVDETDVKAYGWPKKYEGLTYYNALMDCTRVLLFGCMAVHCPSTKG